MYVRFGMVLRIMTTQTASIGWRRWIRVVGTHVAAKRNCTWVVSSTDLIGGCDVWCGWFVTLECNCKCDNGTAMVLQCVRLVLLWLSCVYLDMRCRPCGLWYLLRVFHLYVFLVCCKWLYCLRVLFWCPLTANVFMFGLAWYFAAKTNCTLVASSIDLIGGCHVWCGLFVNLECNCKCDNVIAMVLQGVRSMLLWLLCV